MDRELEGVKFLSHPSGGEFSGPVNAMQVQQQPQWFYLKTPININRNVYFIHSALAIIQFCTEGRALKVGFGRYVNPLNLFPFLSLFTACCRTQNNVSLLACHADSAQLWQSYLSKNQERGLRGSQVCIMHIWGMI